MFESTGKLKVTDVFATKTFISTSQTFSTLSGIPSETILDLWLMQLDFSSIKSQEDIWVNPS